MGPQMGEVVYVRCESPNIIRYLDPPTRKLMQGRFVACFFDEEIFSCLTGYSNSCRDLNLNVSSNTNIFLDLCTKKMQNRGSMHFAFELVSI